MLSEPDGGKNERDDPGSNQADAEVFEDDIEEAPGMTRRRSCDKDNHKGREIQTNGADAGESVDSEVGGAHHYQYAGDIDL